MRIQAFEFEDSPLMPRSIRGYITDFLRFNWRFYGLTTSVAEKLIPLCTEPNDVHIVDLCSGSGGPVIEVREKLEKHLGRPVYASLSDLFPNVDLFRAYAASSSGRIDYVATPLDASKVEAGGIWTIFAGFHHLPPVIARAVLQNAAKNGNPLAVFEFTQRSLFSMILVALNCTIGLLLYAPFIKPFSVPRLLWTYLIPVLPFITLWDGLVSCLRSYTETELREMVGHVNESGYHWEIGTVRVGLATVSYCMGWPKLGS